MVRLRVPPLRERREDIPLLFARLLERAGAEAEQRPVLTDRARRHLIEHDWPGNIRELAHYAQRVTLGLEDEPAASVAPDDGLGLSDRVARFEAEVLRETLQACGGDIPAVLDRLRLPRKTLYDKLARHGLRPGDYRA